MSGLRQPSGGGAPSRPENFVRAEMWLALSAARHLVGPLPPAARVGARVLACRCAQPEEPHVASPRRLPEHLAVIMDGNSRWAHREVRRRGLEP